MNRRVPIYTDHDEVSVADSCKPLASAYERGEIKLQTFVHGHYPGRLLPKNSLEKLKTIGYWDADIEQTWGLDWHYNEGLEVTLLERGTLDFSIADKSRALQAYDLTVTRPWQKHRLGNPNITPGRLHWMIIDLDVRRPHQEWRWPSWVMLTKTDLDELTNFLRHNEQAVWHDARGIAECFQRISKVLELEQQESVASWLTVLINELLLHLLDLFRGRNVELDVTLSETQRTVKLFLEDLASDPSLLTREWTIGQMASVCGLGVTRFTDYSRRIVNTTPMKFLTRLRLSAAVQLMKVEPRLSNQQIAGRCGFSSDRQFAAAYHREYGCSPKRT